MPKLLTVDLLHMKLPFIVVVSQNQLWLKQLKCSTFFTT